MKHINILIFFNIMNRKELLEIATEKLQSLTNEALQKFISFPIKTIADWDMLNDLYNDYNVNSILDIRHLINK